MLISLISVILAFHNYYGVVLILQGEFGGSFGQVSSWKKVVFRDSAYFNARLLINLSSKRILLLIST